MTSDYHKPLPNPAHWTTSHPFWEATKQHKLSMQFCLTCQKYFFYPREVCPECLEGNFEWRELSGKGRLHSFTTIYQPANPAFKDDVPYVYAMVELDEGPKLISNLIDCEPADARVEMPVTAVFDDVTDDWTLVKFRPA